MISFFVCLALLIGGFTVYSKIAEKVFGPDDRKIGRASCRERV